MNYLKPYIEAFFRLPRLWFLLLVQVLLDAALGIMTFLPFFLAISLFLRAFLLSPPAGGTSLEDIVTPLRILLGNTCVAFAISGFMAAYLVTAFMMKVLIRSVLMAGVADVARGQPFAGPVSLLSGAIRLWPRFVPLYLAGFVGNILFIITAGSFLLLMFYFVDPYLHDNTPGLRYVFDIAYLLLTVGPLLGMYVLGLAVWYLAHLTIAVDNLCCIEAVKTAWRLLWQYSAQLMIFLLALLYPAALLWAVSLGGSSMLMSIRIQSGFAGVFSLASNAWSLTFILVGYALNLFVILGMAVFYRETAKSRTEAGSI